MLFLPNTLPDSAFTTKIPPPLKESASDLQSSSKLKNLVSEAATLIKRDPSDATR